MPENQRKYVVILALVIWGISVFLSGRLFIQSLFESKNLIDSIAHLERYEGNVVYRSPDSILWNTADKDQLFAEGDIVSTAKRSHAKIQTKSGNVIELQSNTMVKLSSGDAKLDVQDRRNVLQLIQGALVVETTNRSDKLVINAGGKTYKISDDAKLGLANVNGKSVVFQSLGNNEVIDKSSRKISLLTPVPEKDMAVLSAVQPETIKSRDLPALAFDLVMPTAPTVFPDVVVPPLPSFKKAKKIVFPKKEIAAIPIQKPVIPEKQQENPPEEPASMPPKKKSYPKPRLTGKLTQTVITFNRLRTACGLGEFTIPYAIVKSEDDVLDDGWKPFMEFTFESEGGNDTEVLDLEKIPGHHVAKISLDRICSESSVAVQSKTISYIIGYSLNNGRVLRSRAKPSRIIVKSLAGYHKNINLVFSQEPRLRSRTQTWLALDKSVARSGNESIVSITPASNQPALMRHLPYQRLVGISFSKQMEEKVGVYLVKKADVLLGFTGTLPSDRRLAATAARLGADHGFAGYPHYLKDLKGAPLNKLSLLETIAKQSGPVTVIARGTSFDMTAEDFQKGAKELLWMTSTLSAVYSKKPERIFFPKAGDL